MSCMSRITSKLKKNVHHQEIKEPNLLKNEMYRLNFEREKVQNAEQNINKVMEDISRATADKEHALAELQRYKDGETKRRVQLEVKIVEEIEKAKKKKEANDVKREDLRGQSLELDKDLKGIVDKNKGRYNLKQNCWRENRSWKETSIMFVRNLK